MCVFFVPRLGDSSLCAKRSATAAHEHRTYETASSLAMHMVFHMCTYVHTYMRLCMLMCVLRVRVRAHTSSHSSTSRHVTRCVHRRTARKCWCPPRRSCSQLYDVGRRSYSVAQSVNTTTGASIRTIRLSNASGHTTVIYIFIRFGSVRCGAFIAVCTFDDREFRAYSAYKLCVVVG